MPMINVYRSYIPARLSLEQMLEELREDAEISQQQLANRIGVPATTIAKYESGAASLSITDFITIADALDRDPVAILWAFMEASGVIPR